MYQADTEPEFSKSFSLSRHPFPQCPAKGWALLSDSSSVPERIFRPWLSRLLSLWTSFQSWLLTGEASSCAATFSCCQFLLLLSRKWHGVAPSKEVRYWSHTQTRCHPCFSHVFALNFSCSEFSKCQVLKGGRFHLASALSISLYGVHSFPSTARLGGHYCSVDYVVQK